MSAKPGRFSILKLMTLVSVLAAECGLLRFLSETTIEIALIALPLLNFMIIGLFFLRRGREIRFFWVGFEAAGLALLILLCAMFFLTPMVLFYPIDYLNDHHCFAMIQGMRPAELAIANVIGMEAAIYGVPQLLVASAGGWFWSRYRLVIERRTGCEAALKPSISSPTIVENPRPAVG